MKKDDPQSETVFENEEPEQEKRMIFVRYRGKVTDKFENALKQIKAPCKFIATLKRTFLPSLKQSVENILKAV